jgi:uncharacterized membrane protein YesL
LLNVVWLVASLPVVTIYPATAGLFGVVREWLHGGETRVITPFARSFRSNLGSGYAVGLVWTALGIVLAGDFVAISGLESAWRTAAQMIFVAFAVVYVMTTVYLFPLIVTYRMTVIEVLRNAFLLAVTQVPLTLACVGLVAVSVAALLYFPPSLLVLGSANAYGICRLASAAFGRTEALKRAERDVASRSESGDSS